MARISVDQCFQIWTLTLAALAAAFHPAGAVEPSELASPLARRSFFASELSISTSHAPLDEVRLRLPNRRAWEDFQAARRAGESPVRAFVDPRSGAATNVLGPFPLLPGRGAGNRMGLAELSARLGRPVDWVDEAVVAQAVLSFAQEHAEVLGIDTRQLGSARAAEVNPDLWQVGISQTYVGLPVRHGRLVATIHSGNLVLIGTESWGDVRDLDPAPRLGAEDALKHGFERLGGTASGDQVVRRPALEILPAAPPEHQRGDTYAGPIGAGYRHRLAWTFAFRRPPGHETWEVLVDAHSGEVLAL